MPSSNWPASPFSAFFEESNDPHFIVKVVRSDDGLKFTYWASNAAWERATGISGREALGREIAEVLPPQMLGWARTLSERCVAERHMVEHDEEIPFLAGTRIWKSILVPWPRAGEVEFLLGSGRDVTQMSITRRALEDSEDRYRLLAENAPDVVYRWRIVPDLALEYMSPAVERIHGYTPEEFERDPGLSLRIVHPEDRDALSGVFANVREGKPVVLRSFHKSGRTVWTESRNVPVYDDQGRVVAIEGISRDITQQKEQEEERRKLEQKLVEAQKLESLGVLAGGIAHDFNNLLTSMLGHVTLLRSGVSEARAAPEHLQHIEQAALQAADLCRQLLAYSGRGRFSVKNLDLSQLVRESSQLLQLSLTGSAALSFDLSAELPPIAGDASQLRQVIMNLVINAAEALVDGHGTIAINTRRLLVDAAYLERTGLTSELEPGEFVVFEVVDNGAGMPAETLAKMFDPFFTTKFTGRGLGLSAVQGIVRGHRGAVRVESEVGKGTTFRVLFPATSGSSENAPVSSARRVDFRGQGTILVIDDEAAVRTVVARMLQGLGFEPVLIESGAEGVERFEADPASVTAVLLDLTMPRMDGDAVFRELRRIAPTVPVLLMSGYNEQEAKLRLGAGGRAGFLQKPFTMSELADRLRATLGLRGQV